MEACLHRKFEERLLKDAKKGNKGKTVKIFAGPFKNIIRLVYAPPSRS